MFDSCLKKLILAMWGITWKRVRAKMGRAARRLLQQCRQMLGPGRDMLVGAGVASMKMARSERCIFKTYWWME